MTKHKIMQALGGAGVALALVAGSAFAATGYTLFGGATIVPQGLSLPNAVQLVTDLSNGSTTDDFSGIDFSTTGITTFADLTKLSTDYKFTDGSCGGGSPRFQINVIDPTTNTEKNIFVYIGPAPSYTGCLPNVWTNTGDLLEGVNPVDTSQLTGGTFYDPYATALTKYDSYVVTGIQLVTDSFSATGKHTVLIDNTMINNTTHTYDPNTPTNKDQCKKDGYKTLEDANGQPFKNQGQCVSYFNHQ
jgi:hypothetical protein